MTDNEDKKLGKKFFVRLFIVILLVVIAACSFTFGINYLINGEKGYQEVTVSTNSPSSAFEMKFIYNFGQTDLSVPAEKRAVTKLYSDLSLYYYHLFDVYKTYSGLNNIASINNSPNVELTVPSDLYNSLKIATKDEHRNIYLGPIYEVYNVLFSCESDIDASNWDPLKSSEIRSYFDSILEFAKSDNYIHLEFKDDNVIILHVNEEYIALAKEIGVSHFIDFYYIKNAFIVDFIADKMIESGYTHGSISSLDGYVRNFDDTGNEYSYDYFNTTDHGIEAVGKLTYTNFSSICTLHPFVLTDLEASEFIYQYKNGEYVTRYISIEDGLSHDSSCAVVVFSEKLKCTDLMYAVLPYYQNDNPTSFEMDNCGIIFSDGNDIKAIIPDTFTFKES